MKSRPGFLVVMLTKVGLICLLSLVSGLVCEEGQTQVLAKEAPLSQTQGERDAVDANWHQVVLLVRFAGDSTGDGATGLNAKPLGGAFRTQWESLVDQFNGDHRQSYESQTLFTYLSTISHNRVRAQSEFPQTIEDSGTVRYLTLPHERTYYENRNESITLVQDSVAAFNEAYPSFDASGLDGDGDGFLDNLLVVPEVGNNAPTESTNPLWPHKSDAYSSELRLTGKGTVRVGTYTVIGTGRVRVPSVMVHETLHCFGASDLYTKALGSSEVSRPVYLWDIMAETGSTQLSWPLAQTRADMGMLEIPEVSTSGTYTLHAPALGERQAIKVKTSTSASEYFVFEYRAKGRYAEGNLLDLDSKIGGSGLIAYRVNPALKQVGNKGGQGFYLYVFRPGDTELASGAGEVMEAYHALAHNPTIGASNAQAAITQGALCYSSGVNSRITAQVIAETNDSVTFELTLPQESEDAWSEVSGSQHLPAIGTREMKLAATADAVYTLVSTDPWQAPVVSLYRTDDSGTQSLGTVERGLQNAQVVVYQDEPWVVGHKGGVGLCLYRHGTQGWTLVAHSSGAEVGQNCLSASVVAGRLVMACDEQERSKLGVYSWDGNALEALEGPSQSYQHLTGPVVFGLNGAVVVGATSFWDGATYLHRWQEGEWTTERLLLPQAAKFMEAARLGDETYLVCSHDFHVPSLVVFDSNGQVKTVQSVAEGPNNTLDLALASSGEALYLGVVDSQNTLQAKVLSFNPQNSEGCWELAGNVLLTPASSLDLATRDGKLYGAVCDGMDGGSQSFLKSLEVGGSKVSPEEWLGSWTAPKPDDSDDPSKPDDDSTDPATPVATQTVWRLYNPYTGEHHYTVNENEYHTLPSLGWRQEGRAWVSPESSSVVVWRLYNPYTSDHHYTKNAQEYTDLATQGWRQEGIAWYGAEEGPVVYRLFNPYVTGAGTHHYTLDAHEYADLATQGWRQEGEAWQSMAAS